MSVKELFVQAPRLCGAQNANQHSKIAYLVWDYEINYNGFPRQHGESRIDFLFDWPCADEAKKEYCRSLARLNELSHYASEHGDTEAGLDAAELAKSLAMQEPSYPDVSKVLTVAQATRGWWGD